MCAENGLELLFGLLQIYVEIDRVVFSAAFLVKTLFRAREPQMDISIKISKHIIYCCTIIMISLIVYVIILYCTVLYNICKKVKNTYNKFKRVNVIITELRKHN